MKNGQWKYRAKKLKGSYGETDFDKKTITVDKARHKKAKKQTFKQRGFSKKDASLINTIVHEKMHQKHPKMHEKTVRRKSRKVVKKLSPKTKKKLYAKFR